MTTIMNDLFEQPTCEEMFERDDWIPEDAFFQPTREMGESAPPAGPDERDDLDDPFDPLYEEAMRDEDAFKLANRDIGDPRE